MASFDTWLRELRAAGKGGERLPQLAIDRGLPWQKVLSFGADWHADAFAASLRLSPDAGGSTLVDLTVAVGAYAAGATAVTLSLTKLQTAALPADDDFDGVAELAFDLLRTPSGGTQYRVLAGVIPVTGKVTNAA